VRDYYTPPKTETKTLAAKPPAPKPVEPPKVAETPKLMPPPVKKADSVAKTTPQIPNLAKPDSLPKAPQQIAKAVKTDTVPKVPQQATATKVDTAVNAPAQLAVAKPATTVVTTQADDPDKQTVVTAQIASIFNMRDSSNYYFVVNVNSGTTNLSSSRFGIGQFNRVNYTGKGIKHQLMAVGTDNQLIFVGRFLTLDGVKKYARQIVPLLPDIMKVPQGKYSFFIITQENLNKLADKTTLDSYVDYYQKNY
jgi:hypothetical protein